MLSLIIYSLLTSACFYLGSRALITRWLWSRYPRPFAVFFDCAACSGFWFGLILSAILRLPIPCIQGPEWASLVVVGLCSVVWTPIVAGIMQAGLERLGSAVSEDENGGQA